MAEELETVEELKKYAFTVIGSMIKEEDSKYVAKAIMAEAIHTLEDAVYEKHEKLTAYHIY